MMTSELLFWPISRGAGIPVACTASTVPASRTLRTNSPRRTTVVAAAPLAGCSGERARSDRPATAMPAAATTATIYAGFKKDMARLSDGNEAPLVGANQDNPSGLNGFNGFKVQRVRVRL